MSAPMRYDSTDAGVPALGNTAGSLVAVLIAVGVTGYNVRSVASITVASGVATAAHGAAHGYTADTGKLVRIAGSAVPALNGDKQPLSATANTWTFAAPGVADGTYAGSVEARRAPLGWELVFANEANTRAIFKRSAPEATVSMLRVIDTAAAPAGTTWAWVTMVSGATDVDTVTGEVPATDIGQRWNKGDNTTAAKPWAIVGDDLWMWFQAPHSVSSHLYHWGDPIALYPGDHTICMLATAGGATSFGGMLAAQPSNYTPSAAGNYSVVHGPLGGGFTGQQAYPAGPGVWATAGLSGVTDVIPITGPYHVVTPAVVRAVYPGLLAPQGTRPFLHGTVYDPPGLGRRLLCLDGIRVGQASLVGQVMIDLTGPWR